MRRETSPEARALGEAIRRRRQSLGLTLVQVAEASGLSHPFLSQLERGRTRGSMRSLFQVAEALGTSQQALLAEASPTADAPGPIQIGPNEGTAIPTESGSARLLAQLPGQVDVSEFCLPPDVTFGAFYMHDHPELLYVTSGTLEVQLGTDELHTLRARDFLRYPGGVQHRFRSLGPGDCLLLLMHPLG